MLELLLGEELAELARELAPAPEAAEEAPEAADEAPEADAEPAPATVVVVEAVKVAMDMVEFLAIALDALMDAVVVALAMTMATLPLVVVLKVKRVEFAVATESIDEAEETGADVAAEADETAAAEPPVTGNWPE